MKISVKIKNILITLIVFSTLVPFVKVFPSYTIQALCMLGSALYIALPALSSPRFMRSSFLLLLFFAGWLLLSLSGFSESRVSNYVALVAFMLWAIGSSTIEYSEKIPEWMIKATGIISAVFTIYFAYNKGAYANYARSTYPADATILIQSNLNGNIAGLYNHYSKNGMVLSIASGVLFVSFLYANNLKNRKTQFVMFLICVVALLFSGKRGPIIFTALSTGICYCLSLGKRLNVKKMLKVVFLILAVGISFVVLSNYVPQLARFLQRFEEAEEAGSVMMGREEYYAYAISMFLSKPLTGHGWYSFSSIFGQNAHNIYLQLLAETGFLGFIFFVSAFIYILSVTIKEYRKSQALNDSFGMSQLLKAVFIIIFFILYGFTGNPLYDSLMLCPFFMAICIMRYYHENRKALDCVSDGGNSIE